MAIYGVTYTCWGPLGVNKAAAVIRAAVTTSMKNTGNVDAMMVESNSSGSTYCAFQTDRGNLIDNHLAIHRTFQSQFFALSLHFCITEIILFLLNQLLLRCVPPINLLYTNHLDHLSGFQDWNPATMPS